MRVLYCHDNIYQQCEDGVVYSPGQFPYEYWTPYLENFSHLVVAGRGVSQTDDIRRLNISSGPNVSYALFPNINTPLGRIKYYRNVNQRLKKMVAEADGVIIRAVSDIGWIAYKHAKRMGKPIAMEMAACAWDSTWNHGNKLGKIYAPIRYLRDRIITSNADYVMYVSELFLQKRYPTNALTAHASNVRIDKQDEDIINQRLTVIKKREDKAGYPYRLGLIGNLDNRIKGIADLLHALKRVENQKPGSFVFHHLGPGDQEPYRELADKLNISDLVHFDGMIQSGQAVLDWLKNIDLYLQPSYQEGVPRATIEAMSVACPVVASRAGGIPELINKKWLIKPGDIEHLTELIISMLESPKCQYEAATENQIRSLHYRNEELCPRRRNFWHAFANSFEDK
jgi:glycosyltransferase involved in cell wall biosynthesis